MKEFEGKEKKINETLLEILIGIAVLGLIFQATVVWFVKNRTAYSIGLWIGIVLALFLAWNMWFTLDRALDMDEGNAQKHLRKWSVFRYLIIVFILAAIMVSGWANPLAAFLGIMALKVAAYLQPITHKVFIKIRR